MNPLTHFLYKQQMKQHFVDQSVATDDYMNWLEAYCANHNGVASDQYIYESSSEVDEERMKQLGFFFEVVQDYASRNYFYADKGSLSETYSFHHHGIGYEIGVDYGQGSYFFCRRLPEIREDALDYKNIRSNTVLPQTPIFDAKLAELAEFVRRLYDEESVPAEAIESSVHRALVNQKKKDS